MLLFRSMSFSMPIQTNLLYFRDDEGEIEAPPAKKPKTGSAKSVSSGPEALKEKTSGAAAPAAATSNALTKLLAKGKKEATSAAVIAPSAAAAAPAKEHVSPSDFAFAFPSVCIECYSPPK